MGLKKHWKSIGVAIGTLIGLVLIILFWVGPEKIWNAIIKANPYYLGLAFGVEILDIVILAKRWKIFLDEVKRLKFSQVLELTLGSMAVSNISPGGRVGGEPLKAYVLKKRWGVRYGASFATIVLERIADMVAFLLLSFISIVYGVFYFKLPKHIIFFLILAFLFSLSILLGLWYVTLKKRLRSESLVKWLEKHEWLSKRIPLLNYYKGKMTDSLLNYYSHVAKIVSSGNVLWKGFLVALVYWFLEMARAYLIFLALGVNTPFPVIALAYMFSVIIGSLPIGVGGVGLTEGTMILIYSTSAINSAVSSISTMIDRFLSYWLTTLAGLPIASYLGIESKGRREENG